MSAVAKFAVVCRKEGIKQLGAVSHGADLEQAQPPTPILLFFSPCPVQRIHCSFFHLALFRSHLKIFHSVTSNV